MHPRVGAVLVYVQFSMLPTNTNSVPRSIFPCFLLKELPSKMCHVEITGFSCFLLKELPNNFTYAASVYIV